MGGRISTTAQYKISMEQVERKRCDRRLSMVVRRQCEAISLQDAKSSSHLPWKRPREISSHRKI